MNIILRLEEERDFSAVENLTREAFWNVYNPGCNEHFILHNLRKSQAFVKELDFVAELDGEIVGHIAYTKGRIVNNEEAGYEAICFGPVSVLPQYQGKGIGGRLITHTLKIAATMGFKVVVIFGHPEYYHRFGFENAERFGIQTADGENFDAFMARELVPGTLRNVSGSFLYDKAFHVNGKDLEEFDKAFPPKEKLVTDTQLRVVSRSNSVG